MQHLLREKAKDDERKAAKARANEEHHRATAKANIEAKANREAKKLEEWDEEMKLNAQWKALLDEQEAARTGLYERLREKIKKVLAAAEDDVKACVKFMLNKYFGQYEEWGRALDKKDDVEPHNKNWRQTTIYDNFIKEMDQRFDLSNSHEKELHRLAEAWHLIVH